jgi:hypothetical protein
MSRFKVALNNASQGTLDVSPSLGGGVQMQPSLQRTVYVMGPRKINRELKDGMEFTDCNYWKRFCSYTNTVGGLADEQTAILTCIYDDGTVYSDDPSENVYPKARTFEVANADVFADEHNVYDIVGTYGQPAIFVELVNQDAQNVQVKLNGDTGAIFTLGASDTWVFNHGDLQVTKVELAGTAASGGIACTVDIVIGVQSAINS